MLRIILFFAIAIATVSAQGYATSYYTNEFLNIGFADKELGLSFIDEEGTISGTYNAGPNSALFMPWEVTTSSSPIFDNGVDPPVFPFRMLIQNAALIEGRGIYVSMSMSGRSDGFTMTPQCQLVYETNSSVQLFTSAPMGAAEFSRSYYTQLVSDLYIPPDQVENGGLVKIYCYLDFIERVAGDYNRFPSFAFIIYSDFVAPTTTNALPSYAYSINYDGELAVTVGPALNPGLIYLPTRGSKPNVVTAVSGEVDVFDLFDVRIKGRFIVTGAGKVISYAVYILDVDPIVNQTLLVKAQMRYPYDEFGRLTFGSRLRFRNNIEFEGTESALDIVTTSVWQSVISLSTTTSDLFMLVPPEFYKDTPNGSLQIFVETVILGPDDVITSDLPGLAGGYSLSITSIPIIENNE